MENRYEKMLLKRNFEIKERSESPVFGTRIVTAEKETSRGTVTVICGENGCARIDKPNGTHKWYYEKSTGQMAGIIDKILDFYK